MQFLKIHFNSQSGERAAGAWERRQRKGALELLPPLPLHCAHLLTACPSRTLGPDGQKQKLCVLFRPFFPWDREAQSCHAEGSGQPVAKHDRGTGGSCLSLSAAPEPGPVTAHREPARPHSTGHPAHGGPLSRMCAQRTWPPSSGPLIQKSRLMWGWAGPTGAAATGSVDTPSK